MLTFKTLAKFRKPLLVVTMLFSLALTPAALAKPAPDATNTTPDTKTGSNEPTGGATTPTAGKDGDTAGGPCGARNTTCCGTASASQTECLGQIPDLANCDLRCFLSNDVEPVLKVVSGLIVIAIIANILWGGIQYMTADDRAEAGASAKKRITRNIVALIIYLLLFAFSQFLIPGGVFNG